ncbi:hypothetical protein K469DRAFT_693217 [Zopfia rhizophila CBS 207.26]|uniref:Uncharacterized protein n=1 Tax=Zopfia rhizophila CBS 207.26 TaxID=1314779 RepID=A0A6A6EQ75_9PEZI|nr:hypothetical protein K469DRAFT_693217 [Zopfia rhizophila CBS 207.26]
METEVGEVERDSQQQIQVYEAFKKVDLCSQLGKMKRSVVVSKQSVTVKTGTQGITLEVEQITKQTLHMLVFKVGGEGSRGKLKAGNLPRGEARATPPVSDPKVHQLQWHTLPWVPRALATTIALQRQFKVPKQLDCELSGRYGKWRKVLAWLVLC